MATDNVEPDLEFDGYVHSPLGPRIPCNVQLWLPEGPEQEGSVSVFLNGPADAVVGHGFVRISSNERVEELGLKFAAEDVHVRSAKSQPGYRLGGSQLNIDHVDRWVIHHIRRPAESGDPVINHVQISLSPLNYGGPPTVPTASHIGTLVRKKLAPPKSLRFATDPERALTWELDQHWNWKFVDGSVTAVATPVFRMIETAARLFEIADLPGLRQCAEDSCVLLTLAARHRTAVHVLAYSQPDGSFEEWTYPLKRLRAITEERGAGPLVAKKELDVFFERASIWWKSLDDDRKDAVRLAVFSIHGSTSQTLESELMSRFAALEGLARRWGSGKTAGEKFQSMVETFGVTPSGLWPMYDKQGGFTLYWLRNEIAHGRTVIRISGGLPMASDHLLLWIEKVLLGLIGYARQDDSDWLSRNVGQQQVELIRLRASMQQ